MITLKSDLIGITICDMSSGIIAIIKKENMNKIYLFYVRANG